MDALIPIVLLCIGIFVVTRRWFWIAVGGLGGIASGFAVLASIVNFQILGAMLFLVLAVICFAIFSIAANGNK